MIDRSAERTVHYVHKVKDCSTYACSTVDVLTRSVRFGHWENALLTAITANSHFASFVSFPLLLLRAVFTVPPVMSCGSPFRSFSDSAGSLSEASSTSWRRLFSVLFKIASIKAFKSINQMTITIVVVVAAVIINIVNIFIIIIQIIVQLRG